MSSRTGDKARFNKQQRRRRVRRAELAAPRKAALQKKAGVSEPGIEVEWEAEPRRA